MNSGKDSFPSLQEITKILFWALVAALLFGTIVILAYGFPLKTQVRYSSFLATALMLAGAAFSVGAFAGFLFSLPRLGKWKESDSGERQPASETESAIKNEIPYNRSNNLVDISDWLTKILVGAGLVQLTAITGGIQTLGQSLTPAMGNQSTSAAFAIGILIYFGTISFIFAYIFGTLWLPIGFRASDIQQIYAVLKQEKDELHDSQINVLSSLPQITKKAESTREVQFTAEGKTPEETATSNETRILWVDDMPQNNIRERLLLTQTFGIKIDTSISTTDALNKIKEAKSNNNSYKVIISDMARPESRTAGYDLLEIIKKEPQTPDYILYTSSSRPEHDLEARKRGAIGSTNSPMKLVELVTNALLIPGI